MKVAIISDIKGWAIDRIAQAIIKYNPHWQFEHVYCPPRDVVENISKVEKAVENADLVHWNYVGTAVRLWEINPGLLKKPCLLSHHNEKSLEIADWSKVDQIVCETKKSEEILRKKYWNVNLISLGVDLNRFQYNNDYPPQGENHIPTVGYVGRIVKWKRLKEIAQVCKELKVRILVVGYIDDSAYWEEVKSVGADIIPYWRISDEEVVDIYKRMTVFVCNSADGRETGPLPVLEAMAMGVPVLTTKIGWARDHCKDNEDVIFIKNLKEDLKRLLIDKKKRIALREKAWDTVRKHPDMKLARQYSNLYYKTLWKEDLVSVIIPTYNRREILIKILEAIEVQDYPAKEVVIGDDGSTDGTEKAVKKWQKEHKLNIKYVNTGRTEGYNLAEARNLAAMEAEGNYLMFLDDRFLPLPNVIRQFVSVIKDYKGKIWLWGNKGAGRRDFIENFSFVRRQDFVDMGMFCSEIRQYGGLSQEIRLRARRQGFNLKYVEGAEAQPIIKTKSKSKKRLEIVKSKFDLWKMGMEK